MIVAVLALLTVLDAVHLVQDVNYQRASHNQYWVLPRLRERRSRATLDTRAANSTRSRGRLGTSRRAATG